MTPIRPHPERARLEADLKQLAHLGVPWSGPAYRGAAPAYAHDPEFLNGMGSRTHGNRWNPPGACATVYACLEADNVIPEALAATRAYGIPDADALPQVIRSLDCALESVLDLRDPATQAQLGLSLTAILAEDWRATMNAGGEALSQAIGHAAFLAGFEGLLVPSAVDPGKTNVVAFPANFKHGNALRPGPET